ncbi:MAG TPA: NADH-quinone oxidoreductase subunit C [Allosphingosinicella sp.]|nr:NADH-quinone oxidoreductase subunit C [Allosphingosinicella sp.]
MASPAPVIPARAGIVEEVKAAIGAAFLAAKDEVDEVSIDVARDSVAEVLTTLRDRLEYQQLMEIAGVDYPERAERFEVVYHLLSVTRNHRLRVRVSTDEEQPVPTVTGVFPVAGWLEREVFDMYGVIFAGNPDLRRILTDYGFRGHPQRKDFPLTGYVELRYSEEEKRVVYEPVSLAQDFRTFDFLSPWEGAEYVIPGDEKAQPEAPGAPTPLKAAEIARPAVSRAATKAKTPKTTETKADTGAGEPANTEAAKTTAQKPRARKAAPPRPDAAAASEAPRARKPRAPRKPKSDA